MKLKTTVQALLLLACCGGPDLAVDEHASPTITASLVPNGNGTPQKWTPSAGNAWQTIDEFGCNGNTDYIEADATNEDAAYTVSLSSIPNGSLITEVTLYACAARPFSGTASLQLGYKFGSGSIVYGSAHSVSSSTYSTKQTNLTMGQLKSSGTALAIAVKSGNTTVIRVSNYSVEIEYVQVPSGLHFEDQTLLWYGTAVQTELAWNQMSDNAGYRVEVSTDGGSGWSTATDTGTNVNSALHTVTPSGTIAPRYRVRSKGVGGHTSDPSSSITGLRAPSNLQIARDGSTGAMLTWTNNDTAARIRIFKVDENNQVEQVGSDLSGSATSHEISCCAEPGYYQVTADSLASLNVQSSAALATYVPPPASLLEADGPPFSSMVPNGGLDPAAAANNGDDLITTWLADWDDQPWLADVECEREYRVSIAGGWLTVQPTQDYPDVYGHISIPSDTHDYRRRCEWDGNFSDWDYLDGVPGPLNLIVFNASGNTYLNWDDVAGAEEYRVAWLDGGFWTEGFYSPVSTFTRLGITTPTTYHVFAIDTDEPFDRWSPQSTNVTGP